ncbi:MAG: hypothetical protein HQK63_01840 [Desulfamplus sp.]|nr:hypothetical protein [Desulfamplus sp.]
MLDIKKYSNGRFFDAVNRKFIKADRIKELIKKGEQIKVTLTTTGEEITESIISQYSSKIKGKTIGSRPSDSDTKTSSETTGFDKKSSDKKDVESESWRIERFLNTDSMKNWVSDVIDKRINQILEIVNLPTRDQIAELNDNIKVIGQKIDALKTSAKESQLYSDAASNQELATVKITELSQEVSALSTQSQEVSSPQSQELSSPQNQEVSPQSQELFEEFSEPILDSPPLKKNPFEEFAEKLNPATQNTTTKTVKNVKKRARKKA